MVRVVRSLFALSLIAFTTLVVASPARADDPIPVVSDCLTDWYVNPDEGALLPDQTEDGLLFDGPSLVHHQTNYTLATVPTDGTFVANVTTGVPPLFKMETTSPYSTINKTAAGKYWSSKIAATDPGGQNQPVDSPADLAGLWNYTAATGVFSFGVGYANDAGNTAVVSAITFAGTTYDLTCKAAAPTTATTTTATSTTSTLPKTGSSVTWMIFAGAGLVVLGLVLALLARRRRAAA